MDFNGDGLGDLRGIASKLDYLKWLGVDALWLSPIFPSPMADFGYDVSNYVDIYPPFGNLDDFDHLLAAVHQRDLKLILHLAPNHTSNYHEWFIEFAGRRAIIPSATGTSGATPNPTDRRPITGCRISAAPRGRGMRRPGSIICTACPNSPTSTTATLR